MKWDSRSLPLTALPNVNLSLVDGASCAMSALVKNAVMLPVMFAGRPGRARK